ncbi:MAG: AAA family ATPase [Proteobacteria bacterium]|nr:AAA family ATPase [Pseudomonadota bacterium]
MYENWFGLKERPFSLAPDPTYMFLARSHRSALDTLEYGLMNQTPFCLITGEIGCGKTTLIRYLLTKLERTVTVGLISNTNRSFGRLMQWVCMSFGLPHQGMDDAALYEGFMQFLIAEYAAGRHAVLIIDEAQNLSAELLEELRVLSNINADKHMVLQIILVGQPQLRDTVCLPELLQLAQRIGVDEHIEPLDAHETRQYIWHRLRVAGGSISVFRGRALALVSKASGGVPRLINQLCDRALAYGYSQHVQRIDHELMRQAIEDRLRGGVFPGRKRVESRIPTTNIDLQ